MGKMLKVILWFLCLGTWSQVCLAEVRLMSILEAQKRVSTGTLLLIDVRSPGEWRDTGLATGAVPISIHREDGIEGFVSEVRDRTNGNPLRQIALICASGIRSARAARALNKAGYARIFNVREGMRGNLKDGPGWLKRSLPLKNWP